MKSAIANWTLQKSRSTGKQYYFNSKTNESLWYDATLPQEWAWTQKDAHSPKTYVNLVTDERILERPKGDSHVGDKRIRNESSLSEPLENDYNRDARSRLGTGGLGANLSAVKNMSDTAKDAVAFEILVPSTSLQYSSHYVNSGKMDRILDTLSFGNSPSVLSALSLMRDRLSSPPLHAKQPLVGSGVFIDVRASSQPLQLSDIPIFHPVTLVEETNGVDASKTDRVSYLNKTTIRLSSTVAQDSISDNQFDVIAFSPLSVGFSACMLQFREADNELSKFLMVRHQDVRAKSSTSFYSCQSPHDRLESLQARLSFSLSSAEGSQFTSLDKFQEKSHIYQILEAYFDTIASTSAPTTPSSVPVFLRPVFRSLDLETGKTLPTLVSSVLRVPAFTVKDKLGGGVRALLCHVDIPFSNSNDMETAFPVSLGDNTPTTKSAGSYLLRKQLIDPRLAAEERVVHMLWALFAQPTNSPRDSQLFDPFTVPLISIRDEKNVYELLPYMGTSLDNLIGERRTATAEEIFPTSVSPQQLLAFVTALLCKSLIAITYFHTMGLVYLDMHLGNILFDIASFIKGTNKIEATMNDYFNFMTLIDYGSAQALQRAPDSTLSSPISRLHYSGPSRGGRWDCMPPEQFGPRQWAQGDVILDTSSDIYASAAASIGAILGVYPFSPSTDNPNTDKNQIVKSMKAEDPNANFFHAWRSFGDPKAKLRVDSTKLHIFRDPQQLTKLVGVAFQIAELFSSHNKSTSEQSHQAISKFLEILKTCLHADPINRTTYALDIVEKLVQLF